MTYIAFDWYLIYHLYPEKGSRASRKFQTVIDSWFHLYLYISATQSGKPYKKSVRGMLSQLLGTHSSSSLALSWFLAKLKIWQVSACKIGPQCGIIIYLIHPTWSTRLKVEYLDNYWLASFNFEA